MIQRKQRYIKLMFRVQTVACADRNYLAACRASHFIELPCQISFCPVLVFSVSLLSAAQHLTSAVACDSSFYYVCSCIVIVCV